MKVLNVLCLLLLLPLQISAQRDLTHYVDPLIGTAGHGHTFPGATMPFGMVQLSPDTRLTGWDGCSGYHYSDHIIYGFSHTHLSGTGISDYGDILFMPTVGEVYLNAGNGRETDKGYATRFSHQNESARPGYYAVKLDDDNVLVELTTTRRVGFHRYLFPKTDHANVILDLAHRDKVLESYLRVVDSTHIEGFRRSEAWAKNQVVYFVAEFSQPFLESNITIDDEIAGLSEGQGKNVKAFFRFSTLNGAPVLTKVAISAVSIEGARRNLAAELNHWDFEKVKDTASRAWNAELNKIVVTGGTHAQLTNFYTALYHTMVAPNLFMDADGQYLGRDFKIHKADGFENYTVFSLWDTFRAAHPLYTIVDQKRTVDFIKTFLAQYQEGGRLPVWELAANETDTMIGYHAVSVIADAAAKGIDGFDREQAFAAMKQSAELKHHGLEAYTVHGYIDTEEGRESVSRTLEYAYDDWCIAQMARLLGRTDDYKRFIERAQFYKNVFDPESGFMRPRTNANWKTAFDPREVDFSFTEANSWQYSFFVPQDISGLIELLGGKERFARKLDQLFAADSRTTGREQSDITGLIGQYAHGNEPSHHMAYLYNYAGQPWKTQSRVRQIMDNFYKPEPDGLIGNEDCGQMSAWYVLSAAGFYPVTPGSQIYAIGTPIFPEMRFNLENGKTFVIKARGVSERNIYIQSATLQSADLTSTNLRAGNLRRASVRVANTARPYHKSYFTHSDVMAGGELVFEMGPQPNSKWGAGVHDIPVSHIASPEIIPVPVIRAAGKTFKEQLEISIEALGRASNNVQNPTSNVQSPKSNLQDGMSRGEEGRFAPASVSSGSDQPKPQTHGSRAVVDCSFSLGVPSAAVVVAPAGRHVYSSASHSNSLRSFRSETDVEHGRSLTVREDLLVPTAVVGGSSRLRVIRHRRSFPTLPDNLRRVYVHYTTDGSEPGLNSPRFTKPFLINRSSTVKAVAIANDGIRSLVATARYLKIPHNWSITLLSKYSPQYTGGGDFALIDGIRGTTNWSGDRWQGYQGQDFVAIINLEKVQSVSRLGAGFLQDIGSWIWMPTRVDFELSLDGINFVPALSILNDVPDGSPGRSPTVREGSDASVIIKNFVNSITPQNARYIRIHAHNYGTIPPWHPSHGGAAWIFIDEIIIE